VVWYSGRDGSTGSSFRLAKELAPFGERAARSRFATRPTDARPPGRVNMDTAKLQGSVYAQAVGHVAIVAAVPATLFVRFCASACPLFGRMPF
jgi:hypothetical protein